MSELVEIAPGRWRFVRPTPPPARSDLPCPHVISDAMPPTEQVDGVFYESKSRFRAVGKALGLIEVGNEKPKPLDRSTNKPYDKRRRREAIERVVAQYRQGRRPMGGRAS